MQRRVLPVTQGVDAYEPRVVHQLLDFMYGYVSGVLQDAEVTGPGQMRSRDSSRMDES